MTSALYVLTRVGEVVMGHIVPRLTSALPGVHHVCSPDRRGANRLSRTTVRSPPITEPESVTCDNFFQTLGLKKMDQGLLCLGKPWRVVRVSQVRTSGQGLRGLALVPPPASDRAWARGDGRAHTCCSVEEMLARTNFCFPV